MEKFVCAFIVEFIYLAGSFGWAVDERTRNKLYGFIYLAARLARQWMKERGMSCMELKGHCHAIWQLYKKLEGDFASIEFQN